ncbi:MAG TPA: hypothetical protein VD927_07715 [Chryseosolibacter sp.]|nr:hypothetical protein [Chryseosolibacter sp.]
MTRTHKENNVKTLNVLLIGNNPIELSAILSKLNQITSTKVITEIAFDLKSVLERLMKFRPNYILIDDNLNKVEFSSAMQVISENSKTRNVPVAVLKNSNYNEANGSNLFADYLLKANLTAESIYKAFRNSLRMRRTQALILKSLRKQKRNFSLTNIW